MAEKKVKSSNSRTALFSETRKLKVQNLDKKAVKAVSKAKPEKKAVKLTVPIFDISGKEAGTLKLPNEIFGVKENKALVAQAVRVYLANQRAGTATVKTRGEVKGSTRKIYRQKGTGRARHGARYAPIFVGGGVAHGPRSHEYSLKMPKKMKRLSLFTTLSSKLRDKALKIVENVDKIEPKTKKAVVFLRALGFSDKRGKAEKLLIVLPSKIEAFEKAVGNIKGVNLEKAQNLNTYEVLNSKHIVFLKDSIGVLEKTFLESQKSKL